MNIFCHQGEIRSAVKVNEGVYMCFPPSSTHVADAKLFTTIEDAAIFLIQNTGWGILVEAGPTAFPEPTVEYEALAIDL